jgi:hypothetical protein
MIIPAEVTAMFEPFVMLFAFAIHMMIDLLAFFLEVAGLAILALFMGANCLAIEMLFNAIAPGVQVLFDTLTLRCVAVSIAALGASVGHGAVGRKQQENCQCGRNNFFHGLVLSLKDVIAMFVD